MRKKGSRRRRIRDGHEAASRRGAGARSGLPAACAGFAPLASTAATVLILGTLPGRTSLARGEYYAQPRNAFWPIMGDLFGAGPDLPYAERTSRLIERRIAVWDVCASAKRAGSLDSKIAIGSILPNDFNGFFASHPHTLRKPAPRGSRAGNRENSPAIDESRQCVGRIRGEIDRMVGDPAACGRGDRADSRYAR